MNNNVVMIFTINEISNIKLIIWDLDETFWQGTISDNCAIKPIKKNVELVRLLSKRGIVNSICSKNDKEIVARKLKELDVNDYFVFVSVDWSPKSNRIKNIIDGMSLRAANVLFIDDNPSNRAEAEALCPDLMTASPTVIDILINNLKELGKDDYSLSRLRQYKILEKKHADIRYFENNEEFLKGSGIQIAFLYKPIEYIERIYELLQRSNQLNYTKKRISISDLKTIIESFKYKTAAIFVNDNYGDYGLVGFYAIEKDNLEHFFFSCRILGMGIEQYVYTLLNDPNLKTVEPVSGYIEKGLTLSSYIKEVAFKDIHKDKNSHKTSMSNLSRSKILLKGPCDLKVMRSYLKSDNIDQEFNFIDSQGNQADFYNHSVYILDIYEKKKELKSLMQNFNFITEDSLHTRIFSGKYDVVCYSPLMDATLAVYKQKNSDLLIPFGLYTKPITNKKYFAEYIEKKVMTARSNFNEQELENFSNTFELYNYSASQIAMNIRRISEIILSKNPKTIIVIILLAELEYKGADFMSGKNKIHQEINKEIRGALGAIKNIHFIDVNKYIHGQSDYLDNINHYAKFVYYRISKEFEDIIKFYGVDSVTHMSFLEYLIHNFKIYMYGTKMYNFLRGDNTKKQI